MTWRDLGVDIWLVVGGIQAVLTGLLGYLGKAWLTRRLDAEKARLDAILEQSVHVEKTRFDMEVAIYRDIWKGLCRVRAAGWELKTHGGSTVRTGNQEFQDAANALRSLVETHRPFFSVDVATLLFALCRDFERFGVRRREDSAAEPSSGVTRPLDDILMNFPTAQEATRIVDSLFAHVDVIEEKTTEICEAIRRRVTGAGLTV